MVCATLHAPNYAEIDTNESDAKRRIEKKANKIQKIQTQQDSEMLPVAW